MTLIMVILVRWDESYIQPNNSANVQWTGAVDSPPQGSKSQSSGSQVVMSCSPTRSCQLHTETVVLLPIQSSASYFIFLPNFPGQKLQYSVPQMKPWHTYILVRDLGRKTSSPSSLSMMLSVCLSQMPFIRRKKIPFIVVC